MSLVILGSVFLDLDIIEGVSADGVNLTLIVILDG